MTSFEIILISVYAFVIVSLIISIVIFFKVQARKNREFLCRILEDHEQFTVQFHNAANAILQETANSQLHNSRVSNVNGRNYTVWS